MGMLHHQSRFADPPAEVDDVAANEPAAQRQARRAVNYPGPNESAW